MTLYEAEPTPGGHTLTDASPGFPVDVGFQVFNLTTYPHLTAFLDALRVPSHPSDMSFALSVDGGRLEWASHGLDALFAQRGNLASPRFLRMVADVVRFGKDAPKVLDSERDAELTFGDYLAREKYSQFFVDAYVLPMCAAVWSVPPASVLAFPARMLIRFWVNHHLLDLAARPVWRVVDGRSKAYVDAVLKSLPRVRLGARVEAVTLSGDAPGGKPTVAVAGGAAEAFDAVILAVHSDEARRLVSSSPSLPAATRAALAAIPYATNDVYIHSDAALMPRTRRAWASWNCIQASTAAADAAVCVTYWLNRLQRLPAGSPDTFVTLNPPSPPAAAKTHRRLALAHPVFGPSTPAAQETIRSLSGAGGVYFAGAWMGYGFHEDGLRAAVAAATALGAPPPWANALRAPSPKLGLLDRAAMATFDKFAKAAIRKGRLTVVLPDGRQLEYGGPADTLGPATRAGDAWMGAPPRAATLRVLDASFFRALITRHDVGLGEAYMRGDIEADDLGALMAVAVANAPEIESSRGALGVFNWVGDKLLAAAHAARANTRAGSAANIEAHYDAGNAMYKLFLDSTMTYSSAVHSDAPGETMEDAQIRKMDALLDAAGIADGDAVLEVGCGWGGLALRAAARWPCVTWTGVTLSKQQLEEAAARVAASGCTDRVTILLQDYRDVGPPPGKVAFDAVVSCEMIEAVGHENLPSYFSALAARLRPGGKAVLQAISQPDAAYDAYRTSSDFIREHIFPGGHLVSAAAMTAACAGTGLALTACVDIGPHYAVTLRAWRSAWEEKRLELAAVGVTDVFWRKFRFYFAYCEAAFDARKLRNYQAVFEMGAAGAALAPAPPSATATALPASSLAAVAGAAWVCGLSCALAARGGGMAAAAVALLAAVAAAVAAARVRAKPPLAAKIAEGSADTGVVHAHEE